MKSMQSDLVKFSEKSNRIVTEKNKYWEHWLCIQLLEEELLSVRSALKDVDLLVQNSFYRFSNLVMNDSFSEIVYLFRQNTTYYQANHQNFDAKYNPDNNVEAFGPPGEPGDPFKINAYCQRYASDYYECKYRYIELKSMFYAIDDFFLNLKNHDEKKSLIKDLSDACLGTISLFEAQILFMEGFGSFIRNAIEDAKNGGGAKTYKWNSIDKSPEVMRDNLRHEFNNLHFTNSRSINYFEKTENQSANGVADFSAAVSTQTQKELLVWLSTQDCVPLVMLRQKLLPLGLMPSALINDMNERAFVVAGEPALVEEAGTVTVQRSVLLQVLSVI